MRLALFEPDIPQNIGAFMRLAACLGVPLDIIEPCGFPVDDKRIRRAAMDYYDLATVVRHASWAAFRRATRAAAGRLVLLTTAGARPSPTSPSRPTIRCCSAAKAPACRPRSTHAADVRVRIPLQPGARSLNVALAAAMVLGEALRQTAGFPRAS